ncbi:MAG: hypothetical protein H2038_04010 [Brevundimonas sp.]|uniref:hypothetical protein n=1 Tax=Brevundimonas sp. TaxID=1871086 RepID=UPI0017B60C4F|nr:hypothetical protein [Brevundimonas sp.]MBA4803800.1 hypothetical protein [Brevundimonas sp.]
MRLIPLIAASTAALAVAACQNNADDTAAATGDESPAAADAGMDAAAASANGTMAAEAAGEAGSAGAGRAAGGRSGSAGAESMDSPTGRGLNDGAMAPTVRSGSAADPGIDPANQTDTERRLDPPQNPPAG